MDEEKTTQEEPEKPVEDTSKGIQSKTVETLDRADEIAERQKRENDRREELINREEALAARKAVGGITEAGQPQEEEKEQTAKEYADEVMSGKTPK